MLSPVMNNLLDSTIIKETFGLVLKNEGENVMSNRELRAGGFGCMKSFDYDVYLDHNSTTHIHKDVQALISELAKLPLNASSIHKMGRKARSLIEDARFQILKLLNIDAKFYNVVFTSSGTEANNLIIHNFKDADVFISSIEHLSILGWSNYLPNVSIIKVDSQGVIDLNDLETKLSISSNPNKLVSVMLANNETGAIQPLKEVSKIARKFGAKIHSDAAQAIGKIAVDMKDLDLDFITVSGHKFGAPIGVAALIAKLKHIIKPMMIGGGQEKGVRSGSENILAIAGFGLAAKLCQEELPANKVLLLRNMLEKNLPLNWEIVASSVERLPNTSLIITDKRADSLLIALDLQGYMISKGAACSSGKAKKSYVLEAMGIKDEKIESAIRVSLSHYNTKEEINMFIEAINEICNKKKIA